MADLRELAAKLNEQARYYQTVILLPEEWALLSSALDENERLRTALTECAAEWRSPPTTMGRAFEYVSAEFKRRMQVAADALAHP